MQEENEFKSVNLLCKTPISNANFRQLWQQVYLLTNAQQDNVTMDDLGKIREKQKSMSKKVS